MQYKKLNIGDVRQEGDEVRHKEGTVNGWTLREDWKTHISDENQQFRPSTLLSHPILPGDLVATELRRPLSK